MLTHKRGVENVIHFQSQASPFEINYYLHWDTQTRVSRYEKLICIGIKKNRFWFVTLNILLLKLKIRNKKIFIHSHNPLMSLMSVYQSNLFTVHDALYYLTGATKHKLNKFFWILEKILYFRCRYVHFISDYAKEMSLYKSNKNFVIIPNTSHFETFNLNNLTVDDNLKKFSNGVTKVFAVRSIEERALINLIIEVADKLQTYNFEFLIAGKGPLLDFYRSKIKELGLVNITLLGYVSDADLIQYYHDCDLVLVPAAYGEGFGLPIIEGYLFDKPVIASNVCAIPDVIIAGDFLFENTVDSIISKLDFAREQNHAEYKNYYSERFSNKVVVSTMNELYKNLL
ncbi:glycosyltransferase [Flavobacterium sp. LS1P28]|uniref:glycosyltransferase family 4 protein n=1 Tax=Flavobacterium sp. LS1P28 TaxID=2497752 RepID=UPI000F8408A2|nr:glycosyltransferase family 4 protein [Flavobacterium sp. LS1P28]RTY83462.1 glycosyltransferase [Flavobacterium sp. LS1P28]